MLLLPGFIFSRVDGKRPPCQLLVQSLMFSCLFDKTAGQKVNAFLSFFQTSSHPESIIRRGKFRNANFFPYVTFCLLKFVVFSPLFISHHFPPLLLHSKMPEEIQPLTMMMMLGNRKHLGNLKPL